MRHIRACDQGTVFAAALIAHDKAGSANATDTQLMAAYSEDVMPLLVGEFSPRLLWEGAQKAGMTTAQLNELCTAKDLAALDDLQWS